MHALLQILGEIFLFGVVVLMIVGGRGWHHLKAEQRLRAWSEAEGFEWIESEYRSGGAANPYASFVPNQEAVFRITVKNASGDVRSGWVCFGRLFPGLSYDEVRVTWDDQPKSSE